MDNATYTLGGTLLVFGAALIYLALFSPSMLELIPGNRWFFQLGRVVTRPAAVLIGSALIVYSLVLGQVIPVAYNGWAIGCCVALVAIAGFHDLVSPRDEP